MSSGFPAPTRRDHLKFCQTEGWEPALSATGRPVEHHATFTLALSDGTVLRTRISHPADSKKTYGKQLWSHILSTQLKVTNREFWACVKNGIRPDRGEATTVHTDADPIPARVLWTLMHEIGLPETDAMRLTKAEAVDRVKEFWTTGH